MTLLDILQPQTPAPVIGARVVMGSPEPYPTPRVVIALTAQDHRRIRAMRDNGYSFKEIGKRIGVSPTHIRRLVRKMEAK